MKPLVTTLLAVSLFSAPGHAGEQAFPASGVKEIKLSRQLKDGTYEIYNCEPAGADGVITFNRDAGTAGSLSFCTGSKVEPKIGSLVVKPEGYRLCFSREACNCDEFACYSVIMPDDCVDTEA